MQLLKFVRQAKLQAVSRLLIGAGLIDNTQCQCVRCMQICMPMFNCPSVDLIVAKRKVKFLTKYCHSENSLCSVFRNRAHSELDKIGFNATSY